MTRFFAGNRFAQQLLSYAASEAAGKITRLLVVVVIARTMDPAAIGVAAAALAAGDLLKALTENGAGQRIIASPENELEQRCNTARWIFRWWCGGLFLLQISVAGLCALMGQPTLAALLALLAAEYLFMPAGLVQAALAMREGRLHQTAAIAGAQVAGANIATVILALFWPSPLALVLPRVIAAPIWLVLMRRLRPWRADEKYGFAPLRDFMTYGWAVLGTEVVRVLRMQADKLIVGAMLGAESLGIYFMAFNAGLGLATSFTQAFSVVLFPYLCAAGDRLAALRGGLGLSLVVLTPVVALQAALAPFYVPVLLGDGWQDIAPVVSILCFAALPSVIWSAVAGWLRASERPAEEFAVSVLIAVALMLNTAVLTPLGLTAVATGYLVTSAVIMLGAAFYYVPTGFRTHQRRS
ncbi:oligosaccharide flippase family protein [uncultured Roseobacter sp.]|uniref:oligosaccharide flippase family protein n=1 Tax=uncultured Roseobacter sp. TaxID=114847 RepID=UPI00261361BA|nr:oligosaccharide flippase family protein [uncultured Roseobacter sp.]